MSWENPPNNVQGTPQERGEAEQPRDITNNQIKVFRDSETGELSGVEYPDGKSYLGLTPDMVNELVARWEGKTALPPGAREFAATPEETAEEELKTREEEAVGFLQEKGFFDETTPERKELDIERKGFGELPVIGPAAQAIGAKPLIAKEEKLIVNGVEVKRDWLTGIKQKDIPTLIQNPETLRELALQEIQKETIAQGTTQSEKFGAIIEGIPVIGSLAAKYARGLIETPSGNTETILKEIDSERERAATLAEKIMTGKADDPQAMYNQLEEIEENIIKLETKIQVLSQESAILIADANELNRIEEKILRAKERVFQAKQAAAGGMVAKATDTNVLLTLKRLKEEYGVE